MTGDAAAARSFSLPSLAEDARRAFVESHLARQLDALAEEPAPPALDPSPTTPAAPDPASAAPAALDFAGFIDCVALCARLR